MGAGRMSLLGGGFGALLVFAALSHFSRVSMSVAGSERIMEQYALSPTAMGNVYSIFLVAYTLAMVPGGYFIDRYGPRVALATVGFGSAVLMSLTGLADLASSAAGALAVLFTVRALTGMVSAPFHPAAARAVALWVTGPARSFANGTINGAAVVGIASTYLVFGHLMDATGWPAAFVVSGVAIALATAAWLVGVGRSPADPPEARGAPRAEPSASLLRDRGLVLLTLSYSGLCYFKYLFFYWMQYYFHTVLAQSKEASRLSSTIPTLALAVGMFAGGWVADRLQTRWGRRRGLALVPATGLTLCALLLLAGAAQDSAGWVVLLFALALAAAGACEGPFWTAATTLGGPRGGSAAAILNGGANVGGLLAPVVTPLIGARLGWPTALGLASVLCLGAAILWAWIDPYRGAGLARAR